MQPFEQIVSILKAMPPSERGTALIDAGHEFNFAVVVFLPDEYEHAFPKYWKFEDYLIEAGNEVL